MENLSSILSTICAVLQHAEERQTRDRAIKNWLQKIKDVADELDDIMYECSMEASQLEYKGQRFGSTQKVTASFLSCLNPKNLLSRYRIVKKMKDVSDKLDKISKERTNFHLREVVEDRRHVQIVEFSVDNSRNSNDLLIYPTVEDFDVKRLIKAIIESTTEKSLRSFGHGSSKETPPKHFGKEEVFPCFG
ncbi:putative disease resistance protein RGA4 [Ziziphus jujuba]|uniref:Disease resistance protein RGA4 n=1 Tax=Ziziphus jujuba TaxID=326968 RepID=A0ABM4AAR8_ZIZJJ|nr:putative disease resistance protein RGA4 [Ziziphus jujuba]